MFMTVPHYPYLLLKMSGPNSVLSFRGDFKHSYECDIEAIQIPAKAQLCNTLGVSKAVNSKHAIISWL